MDVMQILKRVASDFDLKFSPKGRFRYLICSKRELVLRDFLCGCPDPIYVTHGNKHEKNRPDALLKFLKTDDYKELVEKSHGCVISKKGLKKELMLIPKIKDNKVTGEAKALYKKIKDKMSRGMRLTLIWEPSKKEKREGHWDRVLLHEFVHELLESNDIRPKSWKWNEGLVTYMTHFAIRQKHRFEKPHKPTPNKMWNIYAAYTHRWTGLLRKAKTPKSRKEIILRKIRALS